MGNLLINQGTNSAINFDLSGTINTQVVGIGYGTVSTLGTLPNLPGGSIAITAGTVATLGTMGTLGTLQGLGTLPGVGVVSSVTNGSIVVTTGTVTGKDANAVAQTANPISIGGTDVGGTVRTAFVDTSGHFRADIPTGTISVLPNLPQGSIQVTAGTIATLGTMGTLGTVQGLGTLPGVGVVTSLTNGSIIVTAGTFVNNGGSAIAYGPAAAAAAATGNPLNIGGTDSGGTIRTIKVDSGGLQRIGIDSGTISVLPNLPQGSINVTAGTIGAGTVTIANVAGLLPANGALADGFANPTTSHIGAEAMTWDGGNWNRTFAYAPGDAAANDRGILTNSRLQGWNGTAWDRLQVDASKNLKTTATVSVQVGTINVGTINTGTLSPIPTIAISTFGTLGTTGVTAFGTLAGGTGSGAGTEIFVTSVSLSIPSTAGSQQVTVGFGSNAGTLQAGTGRLVGGNFPPGGGIQKQFYPPVNSGTNAQLMYVQAGAGTVNIDVSYFIAASTL